MGVTILMSVTSSCHDKPLWVKPVLSLAGALALLRLAARSASSSSSLFLLKVLICPPSCARASGGRGRG